MKAKYEGRCKECGGHVEVGDEVTFLGRGRGVKHADVKACLDYRDYQAEQAAEMRMESWAEHRMAGTTSVFWENQDYERGVRVGNVYDDAQAEMEWEAAEIAREEAEYQRGYHDTKHAQEAGPAGSAAREQAYAEMEAQWAREGFDG